MVYVFFLILVAGLVAGLYYTWQARDYGLAVLGWTFVAGMSVLMLFKLEPSQSWSYILNAELFSKVLTLALVVALVWLMILAVLISIYQASVEKELNDLYETDRIRGVVRGTGH